MQFKLQGVENAFLQSGEITKSKVIQKLYFKPIAVEIGKILNKQASIEVKTAEI